MMMRLFGTTNGDIYCDDGSCGVDGRGSMATGGASMVALAHQHHHHHHYHPVGDDRDCLAPLPPAMVDFDQNTSTGTCDHCHRHHTGCYCQPTITTVPATLNHRNTSDNSDQNSCGLSSSASLSSTNSGGQSIESLEMTFEDDTTEEYPTESGYHSHRSKLNEMMSPLGSDGEEVSTAESSTTDELVLSPPPQSSPLRMMLNRHHRPELELSQRRQWLDRYLTDLMLKTYTHHRQPKPLLEYKCSLQDIITRCLSIHLQDLKFKIFLIGSSLTSVGSTRSDVDLCMVFYDSKGRVDDCYQNRIMAECMLERISVILEKCGLAFQAKVIRGNVPILKFYDYNQVEVNLNLNKLVTVQNTLLLMHCCSLDSRVAPFLFLVKLWASKSGINCAYFKSLSSYALSLMSIYFLQNVCQPPILPSFDSILELICHSTNLFSYFHTGRSKNQSVLRQLHVTTSADYSRQHPAHTAYSNVMNSFGSAAYPMPHGPISKVSFVSDNHVQHHGHHQCHSPASSTISLDSVSSHNSSSTSTFSSASSTASSFSDSQPLTFNVPAAMAMSLAASQAAKEVAASLGSNRKSRWMHQGIPEQLMHLSYFTYYYYYCQQQTHLLFMSQPPRSYQVESELDSPVVSSPSSTSSGASSGYGSMFCDRTLCDRLSLLNLNLSPPLSPFSDHSTGESDDESSDSGRNFPPVITTTNTQPSFKSANQQSLGSLFAGFIEYYSDRSIYDDVISVRTGRLMRRTDPVFARSAHTSMDTFICVEEPFNHTNTSHSVHNDFMFNYIVKSFRWTRESIAKMKLSRNDFV